VLPGVSPVLTGGECLASPGLELGMADYLQSGVGPSGGHGAGDVDMLRGDVTDSVLSAAEVASMMMCGTPGQVRARTHTRAHTHTHARAHACARALARVQPATLGPGPDLRPAARNLQRSPLKCHGSTRHTPDTGAWGT
jgi:hypothetical protein